MEQFVDYYAVLGIDADASHEIIKSAFKKLALKYHPDVYKGDDAAERMRVLLKAYQTLNDVEQRKSYDKQRAEHVLDGHHGQSQQSPQSSAQTQRQSTRPPAAARRDRSRHYAFSDIRDGIPVGVDLVDVQYTLTPLESETLRHRGLLRGVLAKTAEGEYYCHRCRHHWTPTPARGRGMSEKLSLPHVCPKCQAADWSEYLLLRCIHCCAIFESEQIRYKIGSYSYGNNLASELCPPYELFPLCPYCGTAHWCPTEESRVEELRVQVARRAASRRMLMMSLLVVALVVCGVVALSVWH